MKDQPVQLNPSFSKFRVIQHYRNGRNLGDTYFFITKMLLKCNLLTDSKYAHYLDDIWDTDTTTQKETGEQK